MISRTAHAAEPLAINHEVLYFVSTKTMRQLILISLVLFTQNLIAQSVPYGYNDAAGENFDVGNNTNLYYEIYGDGAPLLILHGGVFGYIDEFEYLIPKLVEKYQVICLATRGHVKSDVGSEPYTYEPITYKIKW